MFIRYFLFLGLTPSRCEMTTRANRSLQRICEQTTSRFVTAFCIAIKSSDVRGRFPVEIPIRSLTKTLDILIQSA